MPDALLYGAYGYTGRLIAETAARHGLRLVVAGRDAERLAEVARAYGWPQRAFALDDRAALDDALADVGAVMHAAGPFAATAGPMVRACLRTGTPYLDVTGEIAVFERLAGLDREAREAGIPVLPGVGFDVVPTDGLAATLHRALPDAVRLEIAFTGRGGGVSRGSLTTMIENFGRGGAIRRHGNIARVPPAWRTRTVDFGRGFGGDRTVVSIPWGDVATAYRSTGIGNIVTYVEMPAWLVALLRASGYASGLLTSAPVQAVVRRLIGFLPPGPTPEQRAEGRSAVWAAAAAADGRTAEARLTGPEAYAFTAESATLALQRVLDGAAPAGFQTPSTAFGPDFVLDVPGVTRMPVSMTPGSP